MGEELAEQPNEHRHHRYAVDGFQAKLKAQNFQGNGKKYQVHAKVCELHRGVRTPKDDGRKTGHTTCGDVVGQVKGHPTQAIESHADANHHVVGKFPIYGFFVYSCHFCSKL